MLSSRNKKGQGIGQVFIFIIAAIVFILVMIFGYRAVSDFLHKGEQVEFVQFKTSLESSIKKIYTEYGSVRIKEFHVPGKFDQICFVDLDKRPTEEDLQALCQHDQLACDVWREAWVREDKQGYIAADENVFMQPAPQGGVQIKVYKISIGGSNTGFLCENIINGIFSLKLEGKGDRTEVSEI